MSEPIELAVLDETEVLEIASIIEMNHCDSESKLDAIRKQFPKLRFTLCSEDDMGFHEPFHSFSYFDLFLVAHRLEGCSSLTRYVENCTGLVIALHEE